MGSEWDLLSTDAQTLLTQYESEFIAALIGIADPWARRLGGYKASKSKVRFPVALRAAGYKPFEGDIKYRTIASKFFEIIPLTWQDGVAELASVIEAPEFLGWNDEPAAMALDSIRINNRWVAELLEANGVCWDGKAFFAVDHPANVLKTPATGTTSFPNLHTSAEITPEYLATMKTLVSTVPDASGGRLGTRLTHIQCRPDEEQAWLDVLGPDRIVKAIEEAGANVGGASVDNRHKGTVTLEVCDELSDAAFYGLSQGNPQLKPYITVDDGTPETIMNDKSSALYKTQLKVGFASIKRGYAGLAMPQSIHRFEL